MKLFLLFVLALIIVAQILAQEDLGEFSEAHYDQEAVTQGEDAGEGIPSMLLDAASRGDIDGMKDALDNGESIFTLNVNGWSPVMFAAATGSVEAVRFLFENGGDVNLANSEGVTPLMLATMQGNKELVEYLLSCGANPSYIADDNSTAQSLSSGRKLISLILAEANLLYNIANGPVTDNNDDDEYTDNVIMEALDNGAFVDLATGSGWTALIYFAAHGKGDLVRDLLSNRGANPNLAENDGWTALHFAAVNGHEDVVKSLLEGGADPLATNNRGHTARELAVSSGFQDIADMIPETAQDAQQDL